MILLIGGATHTGKTCLAQRLLERHHYPCLSIDHLKMGLIRSGNTTLTPMDPDEALTAYLWPIVREMVKTAIENGQNLIVEGCYIPFDWAKDFSEEYLPHIRCRFLIEQRLDDSGLCKEDLISENERNLHLCRTHKCPYMLIDDRYEIPLDLF